MPSINKQTQMYLRAIKSKVFIFHFLKYFVIILLTAITVFSVHLGVIDGLKYAVVDLLPFIMISSAIRPAITATSNHDVEIDSNDISGPINQESLLGKVKQIKYKREDLKWVQINKTIPKWFGKSELTAKEGIIICQFFYDKNQFEQLIATITNR